MQKTTSVAKRRTEEQLELYSQVIYNFNEVHECIISLNSWRPRTEGFVKFYSLHKKPGMQTDLILLFSVNQRVFVSSCTFISTRARKDRTLDFWQRFFSSSRTRF